MDTESPIREFRIMMGHSKGDNSVFSGGVVPGYIQTFTIDGTAYIVNFALLHFLTISVKKTLKRKIFPAQNWPTDHMGERDKNEMSATYHNDFVY